MPFATCTVEAEAARTTSLARCKVATGADFEVPAFVSEPDGLTKTVALPAEKPGLSAEIRMAAANLAVGVADRDKSEG